MSDINKKNRRDFLKFLGTAGALGFAAASPGHGERRDLREERVFARSLSSDATPPLRDRAAARGLLYGAASKRRYLAGDVAFAEKFAEQCGILVPEVELKWATLRPTPTTFNFEPGDWMREFARTRGMLFRGHALVWHESLPPWFASYVQPENAARVLLDHIASVVDHYAGGMHSWDVVNEAVAPEDGRDDGLRNTAWLKLLGPEYIAMAFRAAAAADPQALLVYNETWLEYDTSASEARRNAVLRLLEGLKKGGVPVHALGIQAHIRPEQPFSQKRFRAFLRSVADLGLKILITETDVIDRNLPAQVASRDRDVAKAYSRFLSTALAEPAVTAVLTWGLSDRYTWIASYLPRADDQPVRPLPLDVNLQMKPAWLALAAAFDRAPLRTP